MRRMFCLTMFLYTLNPLFAYQPPAVTEMRGGNNNTLLPNQLSRDRTISMSVMERLRKDYETAPYANQVDVYVIDGVVTLTGRLDNNRIRLAMEYKARGVSGVRSVINDIELVYGPS